MDYNHFETPERMKLIWYVMTNDIINEWVDNLLDPVLVKSES